MAIKDELQKIVGPKYVTDEPKVLEDYSKDHSLTSPGKASFVVYVGRTEEVQGIVRLCNEHHVPLVPCSSRVHFRGSTIPKQGGVIIDFKRMNKILSVNDRNRYVMIEPGVTWSQIQRELAERELMVCPPLLPHPDQSVITTFLEREPLVISLYEYAEPLMSMEVVWPDGTIFRTGSASAPNFPKTFVEGTNPMGPGTLDFYRLLQGAQGTMGIVTWAMLKAEYLAPESRAYFVGFDQVEAAVEPLYRIQRKKIGYECFMMNRLDLASILAEEGREALEGVKRSLPEWILLVILRSARRRPEEKFAYEEEALKQVMTDSLGLELRSSLPGLPNSGRKLSQMLRQPWKGNTYWKHRYQGNCQEIFFISEMSQVPEFVEIMHSVAGRNDFLISKVGCYVQPIENGRSCHCEFDLFYRPEDPDEVEKVKRITREGVENLLNEGASFTRPYGVLSDVVYRKASDYTMALKKVKTIFDSNNILNPGNLCF